ncbi:MAG: hypothetical protein ABIJ59_17060 [Pseudomonadota bacterium]
MATINDIVLIHLEDTPVSFARIESILPDAKKNWYHIRLLMLQIPLQAVTWILKEEYLNGDEFFMNGKQMKLKKVECPIQELSEFSPSNPAALSGQTKKKQLIKEIESGSKDTGEIISFADLKNKDKKK